MNRFIKYVLNFKSTWVEVFAFPLQWSSLNGFRRNDSEGEGETGTSLSKTDGLNWAWGPIASLSDSTCI